MQLDPTTNQTLSDIISRYYELDNFLSNLFNKELLNKIYQILNTLELSRYFSRNPDNGQFFFTLDFELIKNISAENFLIIMKYIQTFGEESITFIKVILHLHLIESNQVSISEKTRVVLQLKNSNSIFLVDSFKKLKVNSYIEFYGKIISVSQLKKYNTKIKYSCSHCGVFAIKSLVYNSKNNFFYHQCEESGEGNKIIKEYISPIYIRNLTVELGDSQIECLVSEDMFSYDLLNTEIKFSGIVKAKNENEKNENIYIKYIRIVQLAPVKDPIDLEKRVPKNPEEIIKEITNFLRVKHKFAYCYNKLLPKVDYNNILFFYYLFSLSENSDEYNLRIHFINLTKNELSNYQSIRQLSSQFSSLFKLIKNEKISPNQKSQKKPDNDFTNYPNEHLIIENFDLKNLSQDVKNTVKFSFYSTSFFNNNLINNPVYSKSLLTFSETFDIPSNAYDIVSVSHEMNSTTNERRKANKIIQNQFTAKKRRNYNTMVREETQFNEVDKINNIVDDLYLLDSTLISDYFKNETLIEEENNIFMDLCMPSVEDYIIFVNKYVNPKISVEFYDVIYYLSEHLKTQFTELQNFSLFDINWISISTLEKIAKISARIEFREEVNKDDIVKSYLITKEFLQQNFVYCLLNKKEKIKGKKGKINFVIEKLKQYKMTTGRTITAEAIKGFGCFDDSAYNEIIEKLNYEGYILKLNSQEFQICS